MGGAGCEVEGEDRHEAKLEDEATREPLRRAEPREIFKNNPGGTAQHRRGLGAQGRSGACGRPVR